MSEFTCPDCKIFYRAANAGGQGLLGVPHNPVIVHCESCTKAHEIAKERNALREALQNIADIQMYESDSLIVRRCITTARKALAKGAQMSQDTCTCKIATGYWTGTSDERAYIQKCPLCLSAPELQREKKDLQASLIHTKTKHFEKVLEMQHKFEELQQENERLREQHYGFSLYASAEQVRAVLDQARETLELTQNTLEDIRRGFSWMVNPSDWVDQVQAPLRAAISAVQALDNKQPQ